MESKFCENCGKPLEEGQTTCLACNGKKEKKSKNSKLIILIVAIVSVLLVVGIGIGVAVKNNHDKVRKQEELKESIKQYKDDAYAFNILVLTSLADIENVGNDVSSYWRDYIYNNKYLSVDDAVSKALSKNDKLISTIKENKKTIESEYKRLLTIPDETDSELVEIKTVIKELYSEYYDFYDIVITPTGNYNAFSSEFKSHDSSAVKKYNELNTLLGH